MACGIERRASVFRPSKALGQSFLVSGRTADALVAALAAGPEDTVLEIGPGRGVLTGRIAGRVKRLVAVEFDRRLAASLKQRLGSAVEVIEEDFLRFDFASLDRAKVIGNLPYSISSQILFRLLDNASCWTVAVLTTQREFAARVLAGPGTRAYAALSVFFERVCEREKLFNILPASFRPRPKVVSTAFRLSMRKQPLFEPEDPELFRRVVKAGFGQRRKTLANNLAAGLGLTKEAAVSLIAGVGIEPGTRAEQVSIAGFRRLYEPVREESGSATGFAGRNRMAVPAAFRASSPS